MKVLLFGASGMIGSGVLEECLTSGDVTEVVAVGRRPLDATHPKLRQVVVPDLFELSAHAEEVGTPDVCLYCLGVSSTGMSEAAYRRITVELTECVADVVERRNPEVVFIFVSGMGTGPKGAMWAKAKFDAEEGLRARDFPAYSFRPGFIRPVGASTPKVPVYRVLYALMSPVAPILQRLFPGGVTDSRTLARAMLRVGAEGYSKAILESRDINEVGSRA